MPTSTIPSPNDELRAISAPIHESFRALREAVRTSGPIDEATRELILIGALATAGEEAAVKLHAERALGMGMAKEALVQSVLLTFGITTTLLGTTRAVGWIEETAAGLARQRAR
ncbi:MAG TPA: carboxymuconolactone decarboxylase family protein [Bordetella sp.]|jgi:alkylhydroperoxidase/carboxymuconolactone decarboxylase family protein YurZ|nr:carboxymuconolactone decarboxylase family protein [Bordetella sp.]